GFLHEHVLPGVSKLHGGIRGFVIGQADHRTVEQFAAVTDKLCDGLKSGDCTMAFFEAVNCPAVLRNDRGNCDLRAEVQKRLTPPRAMRMIDPDECDAECVCHLDFTTRLARGAPVTALASAVRNRKHVTEWSFTIPTACMKA